MLDYLKQSLGKGYGALKQGFGNISGLGQYLKQIPAVGRFMEDSQGVMRAGKRALAGEMNEDDLPGAAESIKQVAKRYKSGGYKA